MLKLRKEVSMIDILILLGLVILVGGVFAGTAYGIYIIEKI